MSDPEGASRTESRHEGEVSTEGGSRVDFGKYRMLFERAQSRMRQAPERVAAAAPSAEVRVLHDRYFEANMGPFTVYMDEPVERGGTFKAPSPMEYFVAGAAG